MEDKIVPIGQARLQHRSRKAYTTPFFSSYRALQGLVLSVEFFLSCDILEEIKMGNRNDARTALADVEDKMVGRRGKDQSQGRAKKRPTLSGPRGPQRW